MEQAGTYSYKIVPGEGFWHARLFVFETIESTNSWAFRHKNDLAHGDTVLAQAQTGGRGRLGSQWFSMPGKSLCFSVCIDNSFLAFPPFLLTQAAAVALAREFSKMGTAPRCKWPNDIYINHKKLCGILAKCDTGSSVTVLGIGINNTISRQELAGAGLDRSATSIRIETGSAPSNMELFETVRTSMEDTISIINEQGPGFLAQSWKDMDYFTGHCLRLTVAGRSFSGQYQGIDKRGRLLLKMQDGSVKPFWAGHATKIRTE